MPLRNDNRINQKVYISDTVKIIPFWTMY